MLATRMTIETPSGAGDAVRALDERVVRAIDLVIDASGELDAWFATGLAVLEGSPRAVNRLVRRAGVATTDAQVVERDGLARLDLDGAVAVAQALARRERNAVEAHLQAEERRIHRGGVAPGGDAEAAAARALVREWSQA